ncbi:MAG: glycerol-3-phosphate dehydrogenase subunit GlpB [Salinirussus sp.]
MSDPEILVLGGGLGGIMAAMTAAEQASVELVTPRARAFEHHAGLIDVLGYRNGTTVACPHQAIEEELSPDHPYRIVGTAHLQQGLDTFERATNGRFAGTDRNAMVPTAIGSPRPVLRYPDAVTPGLLSREDEMTVVGFDHLADFDPFHAAERLRSLEVPFDIEPVQVTLPFEEHDRSPAQRIIDAMDQNETVGRGVPIRESVVRSILAQLVEPERVGFPAVLGIESAADVREELAEDLEAPVFEIPLGPPSAIGRRLETTLAESLEAAGVEVTRGTDVEHVEEGNKRVRRLQLSDGRTVGPESIILATDGIAAGGLEATRTGLREPRFGCHVPSSDDRRTWTEPTLLGNHQLAAAGVRIDSQSRPLTRDGEPVYSNLMAAGRIIGGSNLIAQHAVAGVAIATGTAAGETAIGLD